MEENKKIRNIFFILSVVFTLIIVIFVVVKCNAIWKLINYEDTRKEAYMNNENAKYGNMWLVQEAECPDTEELYMIAGFDGREPESEKIAFLVNEDFKNNTKFCMPNYYPEMYWKGEGVKQDLSELFLESSDYGYGGLKDAEGNELTDINAAEDQEMYFNGQGKGIYGEKLKLVYQQYSDMTVIEQNDILGYINEECDNEVRELAISAMIDKNKRIAIVMVAADIIVILCGIAYEIVLKNKEKSMS